MVREKPDRNSPSTGMTTNIFVNLVVRGHNFVLYLNKEQVGEVEDTARKFISKLDPLENSEEDTYKKTLGYLVGKGYDVAGIKYNRTITIN